MGLYGEYLQKWCHTISDRLPGKRSRARILCSKSLIWSRPTATVNDPIVLHKTTLNVRSPKLINKFAYGPQRMKNDKVAHWHCSNYGVILMEPDAEF